MRTLIYFFLLMVCGEAFGFSKIGIDPNNRIAISAVSKNILLVDVTAAGMGQSKTEDGVRWDQFVVEGEVVEVIRGESKVKKFRTECLSPVVVDVEACKKKHGGLGLDILSSFDPKECGASDCKVGERYVVILWNEHAFFIPVAKDDESWRGKIQKLDEDNPRAN